MKRCSTCNRTYADDTLTFCLADGTLLSAPYDSQTTEILPTLPKTIPSPPPVWPPYQSPTPKPQGQSKRALYSVLAVFFLIISVTATVWWIQKRNTNTQSASTPGSATASSPSPTQEATKATLSTPAPADPSPAEQGPPAVVQAPTATQSQSSDEIRARFSLDRLNNASKANVMNPGKIVDGTIDAIDAPEGTHVYPGYILMTVKTRLISSALPEDSTFTETVFIESRISGTVVKILVRNKQHVNYNDTLMIIRKE